MGDEEAQSKCAEELKEVRCRIVFVWVLPHVELHAVHFVSG